MHEALDRWTPFTVVRGLHGYGKTTAVAEWLRGQPATVIPVWLNMSRSSTVDPAFMVRQVGNRLVTQGVLDQVTADRSAGLSELMSKALTRLTDQHRVVLVLDDAHHLEQESTIRAITEAVLNQERLRLIAITRGRSLLETRSRAILESTVIAGRQLMFTVAEIDELARTLGVELASTQAAAAHRAVGGWPAAVRRMLETAQSTDQVDLSPAAAETFLREEVLPEIDDQRTFRAAMGVALSERLTHQLIRELTPSGDHLIRSIEALGLADRRYRGKDVELVMPSLVKAVMAKVITETTPVAAASMHRRLALWHAGQDHPRSYVQVLRHAALGGDWELMDRVWTRNATELTISEPAATSMVLRAVPEHKLNERPGMRIARDVTTAATGAVDSDAVDSDAEGRMETIRAYVTCSTRDRSPAHRVHDALFAGAGRIIGLRMAGRYEAAEVLGESLEIRASKLIAAGDHAGDQWGWFHLQRGITQTILGDQDQANRSYQRVWQERHGVPGYVSANAAANLAMHYSMEGRDDQVRQWLSLHSTVDVSGTWTQHLVGLGAVVAETMSAVDRLDRDASLAGVAQLADSTIPVELWAYASFARARVGLRYGDPESSLHELDKSHRDHRAELSRSTVARTLLARARADLLLAAGLVSRVQPVVESADQQLPMIAVPAARAALLSDEPAEALRLAAARSRPNATGRDRLELLLIAARALHRMGDELQAGRLFGQAIIEYRRTALLEPFTTMSDGERASLAELIHHNFSADQSSLLHDHPSQFPEATLLVKLTNREQQLIAQLADTGSRKTIAERLYVSVNTVRSQLTTLYRKLQVNTREDALRRVQELGLDASRH